MAMRYSVFVLMVLVGSQCQADVLRAGAAAIDITPLKLPVSMTGSFQDRKATGVHDRLHARGLVLADGQTKIALIEQLGDDIVFVDDSSSQSISDEFITSH